MQGESYEERIEKLLSQLGEKDKSISEAWQTAKEKEIEVTKYFKMTREAEDIIKELR